MKIQETTQAAMIAMVTAGNIDDGLSSRRGSMGCHLVEKRLNFDPRTDSGIYQFRIIQSLLFRNELYDL